MLMSLSQWWSSFQRHWFVALIGFFAVLVLTAGVILLVPRKYLSRSRLLLRVGHESATLDPTVSVTGDKMTPVHTREDEVETAIGVMHSRSIMEEVVDRIGAPRILQGEALPASAEPVAERTSQLSRWTDPIKARLAAIDPVSERESAIRELEQSLHISAPTKSSVVTIEYQAGDPALAQQLVAAWVDSYLTHHAKVNRTQGTLEFFTEQDELLRNQLELANRKVREAKSQAGFATLDGQQKLLETQLESVRTALLQTEAELVEAAARAESFGQLLIDAVERTTTEEISGIASKSRDDMRSLLFQLEVLEKEYAAKYKDSHPKLVTIREQLAKTTEIVDSQESERKEFKQSANPTHQQIFANQMMDIATRKALEEKKLTLQAQQAELLAEIGGLNVHEESLAALERDLVVLEDRYKLHAVLLEQARLNEVLKERRITSINVVQPASFEERPITPNKKLCAIAGLFAAFAISLSLPVVLDFPRLLARGQFTSLSGGADLNEMELPIASASRVGERAVSPAAAVESPLKRGRELHPAGPALEVSSEGVLHSTAHPR
jgi:uncharacterized protein involved in exopolysaccharide biosynthesis